MAEEKKPEKRSVRIHLRPFDHPAANDYYANLTGVVNTQHEVVLMFGRVFPVMTVPENGELEREPDLRVTLPVAVARNLLSQLQQQLDLRDTLESEGLSAESEDATSSGNE